MAFDPTINLGNILTFAGTLIAGAIAYAKWTQSIEIRHVKNEAEFEKINGKLDSVENKTDRVEKKVDETRRDVNGTAHKILVLDGKVDKHCAEDALVQKELLRRLDKLD